MSREAQKLFKSRVACLREEWPLGGGLGISNFDEVLARLCSDERMQGAWDVLATNDYDFGDFIVEMLLSAKGCQLLPELRGLYQEKREFIAEAVAATKRLETLCQVPALRTPLQALAGDKTGWETIADEFPDLLAQLKKLKGALLAHAVDLAAMEDTEEFPYKLGDGRTEFVRDVAHLLKQVTEKPNYGVVAALANVVLDIGDDEVTSGAVRKAVGRAKRTIGDQ
jgi:hypothetical protein